MEPRIRIVLEKLAILTLRPGFGSPPLAAVSSYYPGISMYSDGSVKVDAS